MQKHNAKVEKKKEAELQSQRIAKMKAIEDTRKAAKVQ